MDNKIRDHIINNFKGDNYEALKSAIEESIAEQDEITLPGLGVFFEIVWQGASKEMQNEIIELIKKRVNEGNSSEKKENSK